MKYISLKNVNLVLFDGKSVGTESTTESPQTKDNEEYGQTKQKSDPVQRKKKTGAKSKSSAAENENEEDRRAAFESLISGEYKDEFASRVQQIINRRFRDRNGLEERLFKVSPILDMLMAKYKIKDGDIDSLIESMEQETKRVVLDYPDFGLNVEIQNQNFTCKLKVKSQRGT